MSSIEEIRVTIFLSLVASVYLLATAFLIRLVLHRFDLATLPNSRKQIWFRRIVIVLAIIGFCCMAYGYLIEPYWLDVKHVSITTSKLATQSRAIRIAHISDLHSDAVARLETRLPAVIAAEKPDLIVFTGDAINSPAGLPVFKKCLQQLAAIAPTYVVKGNWDVWFWYQSDLFGDTNVVELKGEPIKLHIANTDLWITGVPVGSEERIEKTLSSIPKDQFLIFLHHYPDHILTAAKHQVDLYCAGHTHGGQIALPFYGALITFSKFDKLYEAGLYNVAPTWLNVNRGIGMEGGDTPRVRFWARPEVTIIDIRSVR